MHKNWIMLATSSTLVIILLVQMGKLMGPLYAATGDGVAHLPLVLRPENTPTPTAGSENYGLDNGSFENDWHDVENGNQRPFDWALYLVPPGEALYDAPDLATGYCECVHKLADQLPPHQQPDGADPLILDGVHVYKIFSSQAFGTALSQTISGLEPGALMRLSVPMRVHLHGEVDPWAAESSLWIEGVGAWVNGQVMGDKRWCKHEREFVVPADGIVTVDLRFKSKWARPKDFFVDDLRLTMVEEPLPHAAMPTCGQNLALAQYAPIGQR